MAGYAARQLQDDLRDNRQEALHKHLEFDEKQEQSSDDQAGDIPTLKSVVLSGDETVIHSARLRHNLDHLTSALAADSLSLQDSNIETEFLCEDNLKVLLDKVIDSHVARMRAEILSILEVHGAKPSPSQE